MTLIEKLTIETKDLKISYLAKTEDYAIRQFAELKKEVADHNANYNVNNERRIYSFPACVLNSNGKVEEYVKIALKKANEHYTNSIEKLAFRIAQKGLDLNNLKMESNYLDPNMHTHITDGKITVRAFTIIAEGIVQKPHYRYLIK